MNYYQFHIGDWALHTSHLTLEEEAIYRRLLDFYYDTEQPIPRKTQPVIRRLRLGSYEERVALILSEFFVLKADGWHNLRADRELSEYNQKAERARENGKKGGRPKKQKHENQVVTETEKPRKTQPVISRNPGKTGSKANHKPRTINQEPLTTNQEPEKEKEKKESNSLRSLPKKNSRFVKPTVDDVLSYMRERNAANAEQQANKFCDHYEANGWKVGRNAMKDWKAAVRNWVSRLPDYGGNGSPGEQVIQRPRKESMIEAGIREIREWAEQNDQAGDNDDEQPALPYFKILGRHD